ncbi:MAG: hypothetical protein U0840_09840 [Gemmataceae bacterium]
MQASDRREFLAEVGQGMMAALVGTGLAAELGLADPVLADAPATPALNRLARLLQETPPTKLLGVFREQLERKTSLRDLVAAGALANTHAFAGQHYEGYHTFMALAPAYVMAESLDTETRPLPVFKVLYRNATLIHGNARQKADLLAEEPPAAVDASKAQGDQLLAAARLRQVEVADGLAVKLHATQPSTAYDAIQPLVQDSLNVHKVVLAWRAWEILDFVGKDQARIMLRQTVRHCADYPVTSTPHMSVGIRETLPRLLEKHRLLSKEPGKRQADLALVEKLAHLMHVGTREDAAGAVAEALADGIAPASIAEAMGLASSLLVLGDPGRKQAWPGKPLGSVHGDSVGVHAADAANAWRRIAGVTGARNTFASLIAGAYHTAGQGTGQMPHRYPLAEDVEKITLREPARLTDALDEAIRAGDQRRSCALTACYLRQGHAAAALMDLFRKYAISEDGALHAEKYYHTVRDECSRSRKEVRERHLLALARVTASLVVGKPAPGLDEARKVFKKA